MRPEYSRLEHSYSPVPELSTEEKIEKHFGKKALFSDAFNSFAFLELVLYRGKLDTLKPLQTYEEYVLAVSAEYGEGYAEAIMHRTDPVTMREYDALIEEWNANISDMQEKGKEFAKQKFTEFKQRAIELLSREHPQYIVH